MLLFLFNLTVYQLLTPTFVLDQKRFQTIKETLRYHAKRFTKNLQSILDNCQQSQNTRLKCTAWPNHVPLDEVLHSVWTLWTYVHSVTYFTSHTNCSPVSTPTFAAPHAWLYHFPLLQSMAFSCVFTSQYLIHPNWNKFMPKWGT